MKLQLGSYAISIEKRQPTIAELRRHYDEQAAKWSSVVARWGLTTAYAQLFADLAETAVLDKINNNGRFLDVGLGAADLTLALAQQLGPTQQYSGADISNKMLNVAQRRLNLANIYPDLRLAGVEQLPFHAEQFDLTMAAHLLEHLPNPIDGLHEMVRVTKPGGHLLTVVTQRSLLGYWIHLQWGTHTPTPQQVMAWFAAAGLKNITCRPLAKTGWGRQASVVCIGQKG